MIDRRTLLGTGLMAAGVAVMPRGAFAHVIEPPFKLFDTHAYAHYLHHKYFEVNYADGSIPLDKWFGTFHDGSTEAEEAMKKRRISRTARRTKAAGESSA